MSIVASSFLVGILIGLTSMGGAALMTPFLIVFAGLSTGVAVGTDLVYGSVTRMVGAAVHWHQGTVDLYVVKLLAIGSVPFSFLGFLLGHNLYRFGIDSNKWLRHALGVVLLVVALTVFYRTIFLASQPRGLPPRLAPVVTVAVGAVVGFAVGLTSVGSGSLLAPFLIFLFPKNSSRVVGTDVFHAAILITASAILYIQVGQVQWSLIPKLLCGSIPGVLIGSSLAARMPGRPLRFALSALLFATGCELV